MSNPVNPDKVSLSNEQKNPCYGTDASVVTLNVLADNGTSCHLPYAHFLYSERNSNSAMEKEPAVAPDRLRLHFAMAEVTVLGSGLKALEQAIQKYELKFVKAVDRNYATQFKTHIAAVTIQLTEEPL